MSIIAFKITEDKVQVAADGRALMEDRIVCEDIKKIVKISDSLIIGATGLADTIGIFTKFVNANKNVFEKLCNTTDGLPLFKRFKEYMVDNFGYSEETLKDLGGFLVINKQYHAVFYYDDGLSPFATSDTPNCLSGTLGSTATYTAALIDAGLSLEDAIKKSAKRYTSINDNVTILEIDR